MPTLSWSNNILTLSDPRLKQAIDIWYLEAFCRDGSASRPWEETVLPHRTELLDASGDGRSIRLRSILEDGVIANHEIVAGEDDVSFRVELHNPTSVASRAHWAQPCVCVAGFCGIEYHLCDERYLPKCFVFIDGQLERMPTNAWNQSAIYMPGQVWAAPGVDPKDVNPRPLNPKQTSNGLIGCFSADEKLMLATAWSPYQELFQGVRCCIHSDFRIGGLAPGEHKDARGKIYLIDADVGKLLGRYARDFR